MEVHTLYMSRVKESHRSAFADASKIENATKHIAEGIKMCVILQYFAMQSLLLDHPHPQKIIHMELSDKVVV